MSTSHLLQSNTSHTFRMKLIESDLKCDCINSCQTGNDEVMHVKQCEVNNAERE